jgi:Predicted nucleotide-binding protein containing TIR-like domain
MKTRRIFVSMPADVWLTKEENETKWAIVAAVERLKYVAEIFFDPRGTQSMAASMAWSAESCEKVMRRCDGCALLGFSRWKLQTGNANDWISTDYNHYEGAVAHTLGLPLLVLRQERVLPRGVFDTSYKGYVGRIPDDPTPQWLATPEFTVPFGYWQKQLKGRSDIFLGYCSSSKATALKIKSYLKRAGHSVLDWAADFDPAASILERIEQASKRCSAGIFLFTKDDALSGAATKELAVPRDNVVFEAGYFSALKGKSRVLIVRERGAKMPADLGGDIYASLDDKADIEPVKPVLGKFLDAL